MNRNFRSSLILFSFILFAIASLAPLPTARPTVRAVDAAAQKQVQQAGGSTEEPQPTDASPGTQPTGVPETTQPTDVPSTQPTDVPTTAAPTDDSATNAPTDVPTLQPTTVEVTDEAPTEIAPAETETPVDGEATEIAIPEATETAAAPAAEFEVTLTCKETGVTFEISNVGADMLSPAPYTLTLDDTVGTPTPEPEIAATETVTPTEFTLLAGESLSLDAGFGRPSLTIGETVYQSETPCDPPPAPFLGVSAVCSLEKGVTFTVTNSGGAMKAEQNFSIAETSGDLITDTFLLGTNESATFDAGYGQPTFTSGDLMSSLDASCDVPAVISGTVWNDANGDGTRGADEIGIAGVSINLIDAAGDVKTSVTTADGAYGFVMVPVGTYSVQVDSATLSSDYTLTYPADGSNGMVAIEAAAGGNYSADFGYVGTPTASVTGTVWLESANYGVRDAGENGVTGALVDLVDHTGAVVAVAPVDAVTGTYEFSAVLAGDYTVRLDQTTLFSPNAVSYNNDDTLNYETPITLTTDEALTSIDFGIAGTF